VTLVVVLVAYPLSFGPACWISSHTESGVNAVNYVYQPLMRIWWRGAVPDQSDFPIRYAGFLPGKRTIYISVTPTHAVYYFWFD
jgi:hypothetical protein